MYNGVLIAFEGIDGAGKTTQAKKLQIKLEAVGEATIATKEPTDGQYGKILRASAKNGRLSPEEELNLFERDRKEHLELVIEPALASGKTVILDRYFYSTVAYQGQRIGNPKEIEKDNRTFSAIPDVVFLLDVDPALGIHRINGRGDNPNKFERIRDLAEVRKIFNGLVKEDSEIIMLDGSISVDAIHATIIRLLLDGTLKDKRCAKSYGCDDPVQCGFRMTKTCRWAELRAALLCDLPPVEFPARLAQ